MEMQLWQILAGTGLLLILMELFVPGFILLPAGIAIVLTSLVATLLTDWRVILLVLAAFEVATFVVFRFAFPRTGSATTGADAMVGKQCEVIQAIGPSAGYVKLYGDEWQAVAERGASFIPGDRVEITRLDGNKVWVKAVSR